jgi:uncharacterized membrane protein HdeD (DUF308 family)
MSKPSSVFSKFIHHTVWDYIISRGIVCLIIGILFITLPQASINMLCLLLGVFLLINGLIALIKAMKAKEARNLILIYGLICLLAGIVFLTNPAFLMGVIVIVFSLLVLLSGINQIVVAAKTTSAPVSARILAALTGIISIILGLALLIRPDISIQVMIMFIGIYFVAFGILAIATGTVVRKANKHGHTIIG